MGIKKIFRIIKKYWLNISFFLIITIFAVLELSQIKINIYVILFFAFLFGLITSIKEIGSGSTFEKLKHDFSSFIKSQESKDKEKEEKDNKLNESLHKFMEESRKEFSKKENALTLFNILWEKGLIPEEQVYSSIESNDLYTIYCYVNSFPYTENYKQKRKYIQYLIEEMNFVRMGSRIALFTTTTKKLPKELRDTKFLKEYILKKIPKLLQKDWEIYLEWLHDRRSNKKMSVYNKYHNIKAEEYFKFNIVVLRGKINERNIGYIHGRILPKKFFELISEDIDFKDISLSFDRKVAVRKFVLGSSIDVVFYDLKTGELNKVLQIESDLRRELSITKLFDYLKKEDEDLINIFNREFTPQRSRELASLMKMRIKDYQMAMIDLRIATS